MTSPHLGTKLPAVDPEAASVLRVFADKLSGEVMVTNVVPEQGVVELESRGQQVRLHFDEGEVLELLRNAGSAGHAVWGELLSDEEAAARFLTVHLAESLATREPHPSGWWEYEDGGFQPLPPWDAFARCRQRP